MREAYRSKDSFKHVSLTATAGSVFICPKTPVDEKLFDKRCVEFTTRLG
jgi:hypothetical protein